MRTFVAIPVPEAVKAEIVRLQNRLRGSLPEPEIRWVKPEQMHLTLMFLGDMDPARLDALVNATQQACQQFPPFALRLTQAGFFPHERRPRVLWIGLGGEADVLLRLQQSVEAATLEFAEKPEQRAFSPHLTLARLKNLSGTTVRLLASAARANTERSLGEWQAELVEIVHSQLHAQGSRYTRLAAIELARSPQGGPATIGAPLPPG